MDPANYRASFKSLADMTAAEQKLMKEFAGAMVRVSEAGNALVVAGLVAEDQAAAFTLSMEKLADDADEIAELVDLIGEPKDLPN